MRQNRNLVGVFNPPAGCSNSGSIRLQPLNHHINIRLNPEVRSQGILVIGWSNCRMMGRSAVMVRSPSMGLLPVIFGGSGCWADRRCWRSRQSLEC